MSGSSSEASGFGPGTEIDDFLIIRKIGSGGYGDVYEVRDRRLDDIFAMKVELRDAKKQGLTVESEFLQQLQEHLDFFPELIATGATDTCRYLVMELCGPSLSKMRRVLARHRYSSLTGLKLSYQMLRCLEAFHGLGLVHRDVKPGNFLLRSSADNPVCLIDFGLCRSYIDSNTGHHRPLNTDCSFVGTSRYASLNSHDHLELSRRDDLISWFYSSIELLNGRVPWPGKKNRELSVQMKRSMSVETLCASLPDAYLPIATHLMELEYQDRPDYAMIKELLVNEIRIYGGDRVPLDWEGLPAAVKRNLSSVPLPGRQNDTAAKSESDAIEEEEDNDVSMPEASRSGTRGPPLAKGGCAACNVF
jgi:serine/threonine protein kinase